MRSFKTGSKNISLADAMNESDWNILLRRIEDGRCTPFLGAGVNYGLLPLGSQIARQWAKEKEFPMKYSDDLARVAQFIAVKSDPMAPKEEIVDILKRRPNPDFSQPDERLECLQTLAELPLPVYLTTNYDDLMVEALKASSLRRNPRREICRWRKHLRAIPSVLDSDDQYKLDPESLRRWEIENPIVFHLHGSDEHYESLVLTEDDYIDFLVNVSRDQKILPPRIQRAFTDASLLFIGYRLQDVNFRVIYRGLVQSMEGSLRRLSVTVQVTPPDDHGGDPQMAREYLNAYFRGLDARVYWGTASQFAQELRARWREYPKNRTRADAANPLHR